MLRRYVRAMLGGCVFAGATLVAGCGGSQHAPAVLPDSSTQQSSAIAGTRSVEGTKAATASPTPIPVSHRSKFLGAFWHDDTSEPLGIFLPATSHVAPSPYPTLGPSGLAGPNGYCNKVAANGQSITGTYVVDPVRLAHIVDLGVGWTRLPAPQFNDDESHVFPGEYNFTDFDSAQCATLVLHNMRPIVNIGIGPVEYNATPGVFSPQGQPKYQTAQDYATWCGAVAAHERKVFNQLNFSIPGNEVNTSNIFPGGQTEMAAYMEACYAAIKAANKQAFVYAFELNMDGNVNAPAFVESMYELGCKLGTCYDGISMHLGLRYPVPAPTTPCYPAKGADYGVLCLKAIQTAAHSNLHLLISETSYPVPGSEPTDQLQADAIVADFATLSAFASVQGVAYANVDDCDEYPTGFFSGECLIDEDGVPRVGYTDLQSMAMTYFQ